MSIKSNTDVKAAIELLSSTLDEERKRIFEAGALAMKQQDVTTARAVLVFAEKLDGFQKEVAGCLTRWEELQKANDTASPAVQQVIVRGGIFKVGSSETASPVVDSEPSCNLPTGTGGNKLRVTFPDGTVFCDPKTAANTFTAAIRKIGATKVVPLGLHIGKEPLVSTKRAERWPNLSHPIGEGYYAYTYSSTERKKQFLDTISNSLGLGLKVEIV